MDYFIDIGNSRIKHTANCQPFVVSVLAHHDLTPLFHRLRQTLPRRVLVLAGRSAGAQRALSVIRAFIDGLGLNLIPVTVNNALLAINYDDPKSFGVDRFLNLLAARQCCQRNFCVISAGTAITLDFYSDHHLGGMILPGLSSAKKLLAEKTGLLDIEKPKGQLGNSTATAIGSGIYFGYQNLIYGSVAEIAQSTNAQYATLLTGGDSEVLYKQGILDSTLLFKGLSIYLDSIEYASAKT